MDVYDENSNIISITESITKNIKQYGRSIIGVFDANVPFVYSIGNCLSNKPDYIIFGLSMEDSAHIINHISEYGDSKYKNGDKYSLGENLYPLKIIKCKESTKKEYTIQATEYYKKVGGFDMSNYNVLQLLACDQQGHYPDEDECELPYSRSPVLL